LEPGITVEVVVNELGSVVDGFSEISTTLEFAGFEAGEAGRVEKDGPYLAMSLS